MKIIMLSLLAVMTVQLSTYAQEDLMALLDTGQEPKEVQSTFKGVRLISGHTTRTSGKNTLDFVISHRFGTLNSGSEEFWGLDNSQVRLGFDYGITDDLMIGIGRTSFNKVVDGFAKYKVLSQKRSGMPITLTAFGSIAIRTGDGAFTNPEINDDFSQRLAYSYQLLIARKFSSKFSAQVVPSLVHRNIVRTEEDFNDIIAIGVGGRYKLTQRVSFNAEYYPQLTENEGFTDALSFGVDIETGGHVFQLHVTNSRAMIEQGFITETTGRWEDGDIHFGFNVVRSFALKKKK